MAYTGPSISLHVKITVAPENIQKFLDALKPAYDAVVAEPENTLFEVYQDPANPGAFKFVENWNASLEWLRDVQLKKEYYKPYVAATEPLWVKEREFEIWNRMPGNEWIAIKKDFYFP